MLLVQWEPVPADLLRLNGKLPSGSRSRAGHVHPTVSASGKAAPGLPKEKLTSLLFTQGEHHTARCFRDWSSLMEFGSSSEKEVISSLRRLQELSGQKKLNCKK